MKNLQKSEPRYSEEICILIFERLLAMLVPCIDRNLACRQQRLTTLRFFIHKYRGMYCMVHYAYIRYRILYRLWLAGTKNIIFTAIHIFDEPLMTSANILTPCVVQISDDRKNSFSNGRWHMSTNDTAAQVHCWRVLQVMIHHLFFWGTEFELRASFRKAVAGWRQRQSSQNRHFTHISTQLVKIAHFQVKVTL